jgi:hypothetical protein
MVDFDEAIAACQRLGPAGHLMRDEEWTACAVWSQVHGITVRGNSGLGEDLEDPDLTFVADPTYPDGRVLTGSGRKVGLTAGQVPTSQTRTTEGTVYLNGNVNEWTLDLGVDTQDRLTYGSVILGTAPGRGHVGLLETSATKRRLGLGIAAQSGSPWFGNDYLERAKVRQDTVACGVATGGKRTRRRLVRVPELPADLPAHQRRIQAVPALRVTRCLTALRAWP